MFRLDTLGLLALWLESPWGHALFPAHSSPSRLHWKPTVHKSVPVPTRSGPREGRPLIFSVRAPAYLDRPGAFC